MKIRPLLGHLSCLKIQNRILNIMKVTLFMMFAWTFQLVASTGKAQNAVIELPSNSVSIETLFSEIEKQTDYLVVYSNRELNVKNNVKFTQKRAKVKELLNKILENTNLKYEYTNNYIVFSKAGKPGLIQQQNKRKIEGTVIDKNGENIIGASVLEKGTSNGTITDIDGKFTLFVSSDNTEIEISYIGYKTQSLKAQSGKFLTIRLSEDTEVLDEIVVIGYGTMKKKDLTGAVASVKMDDAPVATFSTVSHALAGKAAGLQVNTVSAQPGGGTTFRIRGAASTGAGNDPLIVIDGFPVSSSGNVSVGYNSDNGTTDNVLASINPNDIESIEVLKDASSTAIYGARAGSGVILITTKRGKEGKPKVTYSGTATVQTIAKSYDVLNAQEFMQQSNRWFKEKYMYDNKIGIYGNRNDLSGYTPRYSDTEIANAGPGTNWFDEVTRTGFQTQHNLSINGGTEYTKYLVSANFFNQKGIVKNNGMSRYSLRVNLDQKINKYAKVGINMTLSRNTLDNVPLGSGQSESAGILVSAAQFNPLLPVRDEDGNYSLNQDATFMPNPVSLLEIEDRTTKERALITPFVEIKPIEDLTLKASFGIDRNYQRREVYMPKTTLYGQKANGRADIGQYDKSDYLMELTANYTKRIGQHNLTALVGYSFQRFTDKYVNAGNQDFLTDGFLFNNLGAGTYEKPWVGSSASKSEMASFFGRINYTYKDRYLLTATLRADGASNFAKNNRWGYFPSVALGWRFTEENFMKNTQDWLSNGKLRLSYGQTGNSNIGDKAVDYYATGYNKIFGNKQYTGVYISQIGNPDLKWETTTEWNLGVDLGFFNNRLNVTAEYFHKVVSDLLSSRSVLSYNEVSSIAANVGKTQSQGFELTINSQNINTKNFSWSTDFTFSLYRDRWKERDENWSPNPYDTYNAPVRATYTYVSDGLIQAGEEVPWMPGALPGQVKLKDIDGYAYNEDGSYKTDKNGIPLKTGKPDGKLDYADVIFKGNNDPGYLVGLNNTFRYKNFDLNIYFYGQFDWLSSGSYKDFWVVGIGSGMTGANNLYRSYNMPTSVKDVWTSDNQSGTMPSFFQYMSNYGYGDYFMEKTWFIRCRNITLGYTFPGIKSKGGKNLISNVRIYADVNNPFLITPYEGLDVETDNGTYWSYPNVRSFSVGLDITF